MRTDFVADFFFVIIKMSSHRTPPTIKTISKAELTSAIMSLARATGNHSKIKAVAVIKQLLPNNQGAPRKTSRSSRCSPRRGSAKQLKFNF